MKTLTATVHQAPAKLDQELADCESNSVKRSLPFQKLGINASLSRANQRPWLDSDNGYVKSTCSSVALSKHWKMYQPAAT